MPGSPPKRIPGLPEAVETLIGVRDHGIPRAKVRIKLDRFPGLFNRLFVLAVYKVNQRQKSWPNHTRIGTRPRFARLLRLRKVAVTCRSYEAAIQNLSWSLARSRNSSAARVLSADNSRDCVVSSASEVRGDLSQRIQDFLLSYGLRLLLIEDVAGPAVLDSQPQYILASEARDRAFEDRGAGGALANLTGDFRGEARIGRAIHQMQCLRDAPLRDYAEKSRLLQLHFQPLPERSVKHRVVCTTGSRPTRSSVHVADASAPYPGVS